MPDSTEQRRRAFFKIAYVGLALLWMSAAGTSWAQTGNQASIDGVVRDETGGVVAGVTISVRLRENVAGPTTLTNENGFYRFPVLPVGVYVLRAERTGFAPVQIESLELHVGGRMTRDLILRLATHPEDVTVSRENPLVETSRSQVSATVDSRSIVGLPVNGRDFTSLALLLPGVTTDTRGGLSFGGQRAMTSVLVDRTTSDDRYWGQPVGGEGFPVIMGQSGYHLSLETVQEFQVNVNGYSAELGRAGGGVVNVVTKSGTNEFHGTAFEFYRDRSLNANSVVNERLGLPKDPFHFHQFGGFLGGPVVRSRLSFILGYDSVRSNIANAVSLNLPPDFRLSPNPVTSAAQKRALNYLGIRSDSWSFPFRQDNMLTRLDWQTTPARALNVRWIRTRSDSAFPGFSQQSRENALPVSGSVDIGSASLTATSSASLVNVARVAYLATDSVFHPVAYEPMADIFEQGVPVLTIGRRPGAPQDIRTQRVQWSDTVSWVHGQHALKFGADLLLDGITYFTAQNFAGHYRFLSLASFGESLAGMPQPRTGESFLQVFSGLGTPGVTTHPDTHEYAAFIQDEWRVVRSVTVNAGLRYDLQVMGKPPVRNLSPELAEAGLDTSFRPIDASNLAPRVGLAWSPMPNRTFVARGSYGLFYAPTPSALAARAHFTNGISVQPRILRAGMPAAGLIPSYPNTVCGPPDPAGVPPICSPPTAGASNPVLMFFSPTYRQPFTHQGSAGIEFAAAGDLSVGVSYLVVKGSHLQWVRDVNLAGPTTPATIGVENTATRLTYQLYTQPRPLTSFDRVSLFDSGGSSIHHALALYVNKRFSHDHAFSLSYTLSKTIDDNPNVYALNPGAGDAQLLSDSLHPQADRSASVNDQRHRLVLNGIWHLNSGDTLSGIARAFFADWDVAAILTAGSGRPHSGLVNFDLNNDGNFQTDRTPGLGRNTFYLPASVSLDLRLARSLRLGTQARMRIIAEAFNTLNHANVTAVNNIQYAVIDSPAACGIAGTPCLKSQDTGPAAFGTPTATAGARVVQLGVKFLF